MAGLAFERKYIALGRIINHWETIVGAKMAHKAQPIKLNYRKGPVKGKPTATLEIAASSADATLLHYQKDLILERINQVFGERWISAIKFVQVPVNAQDLKRKKMPPPLTEVEKKSLSGTLNCVEDQDIKMRLESLGRSILMDEKR
ncbi:MAG: DUF721 domain-containing protein [Micavibrio sp.]|nr:DUF721 domain-containing protein [Micavibrio sp.]